MDITNCTFRYANGKLGSAGAVLLGANGACFNIKGCTFESNEIPAIGGAANYANGCVIDSCTFIDNNTKNSNRPQVNLTVGGDNKVVVKNCVFTGAQRTKVGALAVSNLMGLAGANVVEIENNDIRGHRYGITTNGALSVTIKNNAIIDNQYDTSASTGGSGISIYDSNYNQTAVITGNTIEKNLWGITVIGGGNVNVGKTDDTSAEDYNPGLNVFKDNGNNSVLYDLYNNGTNTIYAQGNTWNVDEQTAENIETVIYHKTDDSSLGEVIYMPPYDNPTCIASTSLDGLGVVAGRLVLPCVAEVDVYTLDGKRVLACGKTSGSVDLSTLSKGAYIARVKTEKGIFTVKCSL